MCLIIFSNLTALTKYWLTAAQHNQLLDETSALLMCQQSVPKVPTLLEWAAVVVYTEKIQVCKGYLPEGLISKC